MARTLTLERQAQKQQVVVLRKMGWTHQRIADHIGRARQVITYWLAKNSTPDNVGKRCRSAKNLTNDIIGKPQFISWCGRIEDFSPADGIKFDLIIADPPWNVSTQNEIKRTSRRTAVKKHFGFQDTFTDDMYLTKLNGWLDRLYQLGNSPSWCWFWCSYRYLSHIIRIAEQIGWDVHNWYIWAKTNPAPLMGSNNFLASLEPILILRKGIARFRFDNGHLPNFFTSPQVATGDRIKDFDGITINLAQKPIPLLSLIITWCTDPSQWVLDAFAGSGSASLAALQNKRNCYAVELDKAQLTIIKGRLEKEELI